MILIRYVRALVGGATYVFIVAVAWLVSRLCRVAMAVLRIHEARRQHFNATYLALLGLVLARVARVILGLRIVVNMPRLAHPGVPWSMPRILVGRHNSSVDALVYAVIEFVIRALSTRWIVKDGVRRIPLVGGLMEGAGYAHVIRKKDNKEMDYRLRKALNDARLERFAREAAEAGANVALFPDGTRVAAGAGAAGQRILRHDAFAQLCRLLPNYGVAVATVRWPADVGTTILDIPGLVGRTIDVDVEYFDHVVPEEAEGFLKDQWHRMPKESDARHAPTRTA